MACTRPSLGWPMPAASTGLKHGPAPATLRRAAAPSPAAAVTHAQPLEQGQARPALDPWGHPKRSRRCWGTATATPASRAPRAPRARLGQRCCGGPTRTLPGARRRRLRNPARGAHATRVPQCPDDARSLTPPPVRTSSKLTWEANSNPPANWVFGRVRLLLQQTHGGAWCHSERQ